MDFYHSLDTSQPRRSDNRQSGGKKYSQSHQSNSHFEIDKDILKKLDMEPGSGILRDNVYFPRSIEELKEMKK